MSRSTTFTASVRIEGAQHRLDDGIEQLVSALASAYATELVAATDRLGIPTGTIEVDAAAHLTERRDGRQALVALELTAIADTAEEDAERLRLAADLALDRCPVAAALDVPLSHTVRPERARLQEVSS